MKLAATLRRLMGLAMAMLIAVASMPSVQARSVYAATANAPAVSLPALADQLDVFDGAVYIAEESEAEQAQRAPSQRFGGDLPSLTSLSSIGGAIFVAARPWPPEQIACAAHGPFRSPHKTGPPRI